MPGGQAPSQAGGQGCQWGRGRKGHTWPDGLGLATPSPPSLPFRVSHYHAPTPPNFSVPLLETYTVSLPRPTGALTPTLGPQEKVFFFFFLKGPGGVGWLVDDEVSACTHRGFCLPWRVKPRLSERAPPHQARDPLCYTALPRPGHMDPTWLEGLNTEQALLAATRSPFCLLIFSFFPAHLPTRPQH